MWKLLSGIALVVLLDVAFIWMMTAESDALEIARSIGPTAAAPVIRDRPTTEPVVIDDSTEPVIDDSFEVRNVRGSRSSKTSYVTADRVAQPETATIAESVPAKLFNDTIIWIGRTEVPVKIDDREQLPVVAESGQDEAMQASVYEPLQSGDIAKKKRSFQSKAFGVIKAPYNWVKAFADKLN